MNARNTIWSPGKILFNNEYLILKGAPGLALCSSYGQSLSIISSKESNQLYYRAIDERNKTWLQGKFFYKNDEIDFEVEIGENSQFQLISNLFEFASKENPKKFKEVFYLTGEINCYLEFSRTSGLGSSSTFINNLSILFDLNPFEVSDLFFGGSGYDIAVAQHKSHGIFKLKNGKRSFNSHNNIADFVEYLKNHAFILFLGKKIDSRTSFDRKKLENLSKESILSFDNNLDDLFKIRDLSELSEWIRNHDKKIEEMVGINSFYKDFDLPPHIFGKYSGAWGGDMAIVFSELGESGIRDYFNRIGFDKISSLSDILL